MDLLLPPTAPLPLPMLGRQHRERSIERKREKRNESEREMGSGYRDAIRDLTVVNDTVTVDNTKDIGDHHN